MRLLAPAFVMVSMHCRISPQSPLGATSTVDVIRPITRPPMFGRLSSESMTDHIAGVEAS